MSGFCSEPESANSFSMIRWVSTNQVWSWPVPMMCASVPSVSKPGNSGGGSRRPVRVEPQRGRAGDDPDAVVGPDRVPVVDALGVVPHPVLVDHAGARGLRRSRASARRRGRGRRRSCACGGVPSALRPVGAHEVVVAADPAGGDEHRRRLERELADRACASSSARAHARSARARSPRTPSTAPSLSVSASTWWRKRSSTQTARRRLAHPPHERLDHARAGAPGDVEARDRVAVARSRGSRRARPSRRWA